MVPAGYMPAAWGEGGPVTLCPTGLPTGLMLEHSGHHNDDGDDGPGTDLLWAHCPLGALTDTAAISPDVVFNLPVFLCIHPVDLELRSIFSIQYAGATFRVSPSSSSVTCI